MLAELIFRDGSSEISVMLDLTASTSVLLVGFLRHRRPQHSTSFPLKHQANVRERPTVMMGKMIKYTLVSLLDFSAAAVVVAIFFSVV